MTVKELIKKLKNFDMNLPVCINDHVEALETDLEMIEIEKKKYVCFPFTNDAEVEYINVRNI